MIDNDKINLAYIIGVALGDGNISSPNGRVTRLRITCDTKYPEIINEITTALRLLFPTNKVSIVSGPKPTYCNISVYSQKLNEYLPWFVNQGSKHKQNAHVPPWIFTQKEYCKAVLKGLIQTDGSIYVDRGYTMVNFTTIIEPLAKDVVSLIQNLGFKPSVSQTLQKSGTVKYTIRLARKSKDFIEIINLHKD